MVEKVLRYVKSFWHNTVCDGQTDRRTRYRSQDRAVLCVARVIIRVASDGLEWLRTAGTRGF